MATLVLTGIGTLIGGPIGGAIGAVAGQAIDRGVLFKPKGRQGPRLDELRVQASRYGAPIPAVFGTMRVAGTVVWATDLVERRERQGGGKGRTPTTTYSYSASFAVLLSARPAVRIGRIWADGNLLRGVAGDWKQLATMRFHDGQRDAGPDPLIASAEGASEAPGFRGCAYAVFEDLDLTPFGNRIPSLNFELIADEDGAGIAAIVAETSGGRVAAATTARVGGVATGGDSLRGLIETLAPIAPLAPVEEGGRLVLAEPGGPVTGIEIEEAADIVEESATDDAPREVTVRHHDPARDHQAGLQRARRPGGRRTIEIELPALMTAGAAKSVAEQVIEREGAAGRRLSLTLPFARMALRVGSRVTVAGRPGLWRIAAKAIEEMAVRVELARERAAPAPGRAATPGRPVSQADLLHGETRLVLFDLPWLGEGRATAPQLVVAAAGPSPGWRRAALLASSDGGARFDSAGATAPAATIGIAETALAPAAAGLVDFHRMVDVLLTNAAMALEDTDDAGLLAGRNLAALGDELIAFGRAEPIGGGRWRLSRLLRGVRGTEWAIDGHAAGEPFVLIEPDRLAPIAVPTERIGGTLTVIAAGPGDPADGTAVSAAIRGEALRPPAPAHCVAAAMPDGTIRFSWVRRSRIGWGWTDGADAAVGEERERYRLTLSAADGTTRAVETDAPVHIHPASDGAIAAASVVQLGDQGASRPAAFTL